FPAEGDRATSPAEGDRATSPAEGDRATFPAGGDRATSPAEGDRATSPAEGDRATFPAEGDRATSPAEGDRATSSCCGTAAPGRGLSAFTLIEMLVVMGIFAIMAALAAASWVSMTRRASREGAAERVMDVLRQARLSAADTGRGAVVRIDPDRNLLYGLSSRIRGAWHFDEVEGNTTPGARSMDGTYYNPPDSPVQGAVGLCLDFDGSSTFVDCGRFPVYDQTDGIRLEAYVSPEGASAGDQLGVMAKWWEDATDEVGYRLYLHCEDGADRGLYSIRGDVVTEDATVSLDSSPVQMPGYQWGQVAMECDASEARLLYNGIVMDTAVQTALIEPARGQRLLIGAVGPYEPGTTPPTDYFNGRIDEPRLLSVAGGQRIALPDRVRLSPSDRLIHFDEQGNLDLNYHSRDVYVALGDPYQAAILDENLTSGETDVTVRPRNPFPPAGGIVMVGDVAAETQMEVMTYDTGAGMDLTGVERGQYGTRARGHSEGEDVYFTRAVRLGHTGLVSKEGNW
ncbi:MAG: LamG-like jellyroll fold domain-containing protein, partial [Candidatus Brocadiia bacterium]